MSIFDLLAVTRTLYTTKAEMLTLDDNKCDFQNGVFNLYWGQKILRKKYEGGVTLREFELPYDKKTLKLHLDECNFAGLLEGRTMLSTLRASFGSINRR